MKKSNLAKKVLAFSLSAMMAVGLVPGTTYAATSEDVARVSAQETSVIPKITSFKFDGEAKLDLTKGVENVSLPATIQTNLTGVDYIQVQFNNENDNGVLTLFFDGKSGKWSSPYVSASPTSTSGTYKPSYVRIQQGENYYVFREESILAPIPRILRDCAVEVTAGDVQKPQEKLDLKVTDIAVSKAEFNGPITGTVTDTVTVKFQGKAGYNLGWAEVGFRNTTGQSFYAVLPWDNDATRKFDANGCYTAELPLNDLNEYLVDGVYTVEYLEADISDSETKQYIGYWSNYADKENWEALNKPTITITGNNGDTQKPVLKELRVDKTTIEGGGIVHFIANATDDKSGLGNTAYLNLERDDRVEGVQLTYNETKKCYEGSVFVSDEAVDGIYEMTYFRVGDRAGNGLYYDSYKGIPEQFQIKLTVNNGVEEEIKEPVTAENVGTYLSYNAPNLTYTGYNQSYMMQNQVIINEAYKNKIFPYNVSISFKKQGSNDELVTDLVDAGTYDVYVSVKTKDIKTRQPVKIGEVNVAKYPVKPADIQVISRYPQYNGGGQEVDVYLYNPTVIQKDHIKIIYKNADGSDLDADNRDSNGCPINAGTYKVYVSYEEDDNCTGFSPTDKGNMLTIVKAEAAQVYTFDERVVNKNVTKAAIYYMDGYVNDWTLIGKDEHVTATVTVDEADQTYIEKAEYIEFKENEDDPEAVTIQGIQFALTEKAAELTENRIIKLHVNFGNSFTNWNVAIDLPIIITPKKAVDIWLSDDRGFTYDGEVKEQIFELEGDEFEAVSGNAVELREQFPNAFNVTITKDENEVTEIRDAGRYIVSAIYDDETHFGKMTWAGWVDPKQVTSLEGILKLNIDTMVYSRTDYTQKIMDSVTVEPGITGVKYGVHINDTDRAIDVGTYQVRAYCEWTEGEYNNYEWDGDLLVGEVTIGELSVSADSKGDVEIKIGNKLISNTDSHVTLVYYKGSDKLQAVPTEAGTYRVEVAYMNSAYLENPVIATAEFTIPSQTTPGGDSGSGDSGSGDSGSGDSGSGNSGSGSSGSTGGTGAAGGSTAETGDKKDESKPVTETKEDGTVVTTTETKGEDGSVQAKVELKNDKTGVEATVNVSKNADGKITGAAAEVKQVSTDKKAGISGALIAQITEAAGTKDVEITSKIVDEKGKTVCKLTVNAKDLKAGNQMKVLKIDSKTGKMSLINKSTYKVDKDGNLSMKDLKKASYMVLTKSEVDAFSKAVLKTVKVKTAKKNVTAGKKTKLTLSNGLDMNNVSKITYKTSKKSVATVNKNGTITTKKAGKVTVKAIVTLKNGKTKTVQMTITVKKSSK